MIEKELLRIQQGPEDVLISFLFALEGFVAGFGLGFLFEVSTGEFHFVGIWIAAEGDVIQIGDLVVIGTGVLREHVGAAVATGELGLDVGGV